MARNEDKGSIAEEMLRGYFLSRDYYVARGLHFIFAGTEITDVDLWLYHRSSPISRERLLVDIKKRKTPHAFERIVWAKGLQNILGLNGSLVATTDRREAVFVFGQNHDVTVVDGRFLSSLKGKFPLVERLTQEEFDALMSRDAISRMASDWGLLLRRARSRLLTSLSFDGCNAWLEDTRFFMEQSIIQSQESALALRLTYIIISYLLIGLDFLLSQEAFRHEEARKSILVTGFRYGSEGATRTESAIQVATRLIEKYVPDGRSYSDTIKRDVQRETSHDRFDILAEYFSRPQVVRDLFRLAKNFESAGYQKSLIRPEELDSGCVSALAVVADFFGVRRNTLFSNSNGELPLGFEPPRTQSP